MNLQVLQLDGLVLSLESDPKIAIPATELWLPPLLEAALVSNGPTEVDVCTICAGNVRKADPPLFVHPSNALTTLSSQQRVTLLTEALKHHLPLVQRLPVVKLDPQCTVALLHTCSVIMAYIRATGREFEAEPTLVHVCDDYGSDPDRDQREGLKLLKKISPTAVEGLPIFRAADQRAIRNVALRFRYYVQRVKDGKALDFMEHSEFKTLLTYFARRRLPDGCKASDSVAIRREMISLLSADKLAGPDAEAIFDKAHLNPSDPVSQAVAEGKRRFLAIRALTLGYARILHPALFEHICGTEAKCREVAKRLVDSEAVPVADVAEFCGHAYLPVEKPGPRKEFEGPT